MRYQQNEQVNSSNIRRLVGERHAAETATQVSHLGLPRFSRPTSRGHRIEIGVDPIVKTPEPDNLKAVAND